MSIVFYCGIASEMKWNHHPISPGKYVCISPITGASEATRKENRVFVPETCSVIQDSGAFGDGPASRLTYEQAMERQIHHAKKYNYTDLISHVASYDLLIDEKWQDGVRSKDRWSEEDAWKAVEVTVNAAEYISKHRQDIPNQPGLVLSAQGVSAPQYLECVQAVVPYLDLNHDIFGLGGWCITGRRRKQMLPVLNDTIDLVIPYLAEKKVRQIHIWGVILPEALGYLLWVCDQYGIQRISTDSAGPSWKPAFGDWGYGNWKDYTYQRPPVETRGLERARHVQAVRDWLADFRSTQYYLVHGIRKGENSCSTSHFTSEQQSSQIWSLLGLDQLLPYQPLSSSSD